MSDQNFHEIQLSGKQLVFLFMCAVVLTVVVFLFGVAVGREVRPGSAQAADVSTPAASTLENAAPPAAPAAAASTQPAANELSYAEALEGRGGNDPTKAAPPAPATEQPPASTERLVKSEETKPPAAEAAKTVTPPAPPKDAAPKALPPPAPTEAAAKTPPPVATKEAVAKAPALNGWVVQVGAFNANEVANKEVSKLQGKGYPAFVFTEPQSTSGPRYKVRVGPYSARTEADRMVKALTGEGYKPFLTR